MMDYLNIDSDKDLSFLHGRDSSILAGNWVMRTDAQAIDDITEVETFPFLFYQAIMSSYF